MATSVNVLVLIFVGLCTKQTLAYYCDSDKCGVDEYCCGMNLCCTSYAVWQMWYFWCGCVVFVILLSACAGFCRYRHYHTALIIQGSTPYTRLDSAQPHYPSVPQAAAGQYNDYLSSRDVESAPPIPPKYSPDYPPPPYASIPHTGEKDPNYMR